MATCGENYSNDWPKTMMTGECLLVAFAPVGATGNDDDDESLLFWITPPSVFHLRGYLYSERTLPSLKSTSSPC